MLVHLFSEAVKSLRNTALDNTNTDQSPVPCFPLRLRVHTVGLTFGLRMTSKIDFPHELRACVTVVYHMKHSNISKSSRSLLDK